jgi:hypothetical protein
VINSILKYRELTSLSLSVGGISIRCNIILGTLVARERSINCTGDDSCSKLMAVYVSCLSCLKGIKHRTYKKRDAVVQLFEVLQRYLNSLSDIKQCSIYIHT